MTLHVPVTEHCLPHFPSCQLALSAEERSGKGKDLCVGDLAFCVLATDLTSTSSLFHYSYTLTVCRLYTGPIINSTNFAALFQPYTASGRSLAFPLLQTKATGAYSGQTHTEMNL